ncbi:MAG: hypothetical protein IKP83_02405 [Bacteroidales bacterium]|nr:hypothetical protein [Bacteroidales bacterium]
MKKVLTIAVAAVAVLCLASCGCKDHTLKASKAQSLINKEMCRVHVDQVTTNVPVGYFECNDNSVRFTLRKLAANELITYSCEPVQKVRRTWRGMDTTTVYFVTTALTEKGQKLVAEKLEEEPTADIKDLQLDREFDRSKFPEANVPEIEFPEAGGAEEMATEAADYADYEEYQPDYSGDEENMSAYDRAKRKESVEPVTVNAYKMKVVKVRNIRLTNDNATAATAEAIFETTNVNPFGRIVANVDEGKRELVKHITFVRYEDKGWQLDDIDF